MTSITMRASPEQRKRTKVEEGLRLDAYKDTVDIWTIGYGHAATNPRPVRGLRIVYQKDEDGAELRDPITSKLIPVIDENGRPVLEFYQGKVCEGVQITQSEAERLFEDDADETDDGINSLVTQNLAQHQHDALFDFVHQYGLHKLNTSTLLVKLNFNPTSPAVLHELMRWTRAGGEHREYVWRRSARRAIAYCGAPIPQKLWSKCAPEGKGFPFAVDAATDHIDYSVTPTIEKLIEIGKAKAAPYKFNPDSELPPADSPEPAGKVEAVGGSPIAEPVEASTRPPEPVEAVREASGDPSPPAPAPAVPTPPNSPGRVEYPAPADKGAAAVPPTAAPPPISVGTKPPSRHTVPPEHVPYRIDPNAGLKPMEETERFVGAALMFFGTIIRVSMANGVKFSGVGGIAIVAALDMMKSPTNLAILVSAFAIGITGALWFVGFVMDKTGLKKKKRGERTATQGMY